jgi:hypothetical protein
MLKTPVLSRFREYPTDPVSIKVLYAGASRSAARRYDAVSEAFLDVSEDEVSDLLSGLLSELFF